MGRGGARTGAGRKRINPESKRMNLNITVDKATFEKIERLRGTKSKGVFLDELFTKL